MKPWITFIIPVYKIKEEYLRKCIESLLAQESEEYRVILVDDGSPDRCGAICDEYAKQSDKITVIHQENKGVSVARNNGIERVDTPWIGFIDSDDWIEENAVSRIVKILKTEAANADVVMFNYWNESKNGSELASLNDPSGFCEGQLLDECQKGPFFKMFDQGKLTAFSIAVVFNKIYKTRFIKENHIRFYPGEKRGEDLLFNADALNSTDKIFYMKDACYHYRWTAGSATNRYTPDVVDSTLLEIQELKKQIEKHHLSEQVVTYLNCRICTRLYSCMRLYYFHPENTQPLRQRMKDLKKVAESEPFASAIKVAPLKYYRFSEKVFVFLLKHRWYLCCRILVLVKAWVFKVKNLE